MGFVHRHYALDFAYSFFNFQGVPSEPFVPLTDEEESQVQQALSGNRYIYVWLILLGLEFVLTNQESVMLFVSGPVGGYWLLIRILVLR